MVLPGPPRPACMSLPEIPGYRIGALIGKGACGTVYTARHESGSLVSVKLLSSRSVNAELISNRVNRLYRSSQPKACVPLIAHSLEKDPLLVIEALMADRVIQGIGERFVPRTLQLRLGEYLGKRGSWMLIRRLAQVMAEFHRHRVAHGNLKPGNVFLDSENEILLADYAQGLMPGIEVLSYTDALLYAPPEQLMNPDGYLEGAGYGWDVYAFGSLAYRLLTGQFPRCHDTFEQVAPPVGEQRRRGVEADCERIAMKLERTGIAPWTGDAPTREEADGRQVIERCLHLDPWKRYADMREVLRALESIASSRQQRMVQEADQERVEIIERRGKGWRLTAGIGMAACVTMGAVLTYQAINKSEDDPAPLAANKEDPEAKPSQDNEDEERERARLERELAKALSELAESEQVERSSIQAQEEVRKMAAVLASSYTLSDQLLSWSIERGAKGVPALEGRLGRLSILENNLSEHLKIAEEQPLVADNAWRFRMALAEVALAAEKPKVARDHLKQVLSEASATDSDTEYRLARARVLVCYLGSQIQNEEVTPGELAETETVLASLPEGTPKTRRLKSALKVAEARMQLRNGDSEAALENYRNAFADMTKLCEEKPSLAALRLWRARGYTSAAKAAQGAGEVDAASLLREKAAVELVEILREQPHDPEVQIETSQALGAIAEAALEDGQVEHAEDLATKSLELLQTAVTNPEEREGALIQIATQKSVLAACRAGTGYGKNALRLIREGVGHIEAALQKYPDDPVAKFRLGILMWQESGLRGTDGYHTEALKMGMEAHEILVALRKRLKDDPAAHPSIREIDRSLAYLTTHLGSTAQMARRNSDAKRFFEESLTTWAALKKTEGEKAEFEEGLKWAEMCLQELGVPRRLPSVSIPRKRE